MTFYKILKYSFLLLCCFCYQQGQLSAQIMAHGTSQSLSGTATASGNKSTPDIASDEAVVWITCWATPSAIYVATSNHSGASWSAPQQIFTTSELVVPSIATDKNGKWLITWRDGMDIKVTESNDLGVNWSTPTLISTSPNTIIQNISDPVIASDGNGTWKIVWGEDHQTDWSVYGATSSNNAESWAAPTLIKSHPVTAGVLTGINALSLETDDNNNWISIWTLKERSFDFNANTVSDQTTLWSAACDGNTWANAQIIAQNDIINNPTLTNNGGADWIAVWEEESYDNNSVLQHQIHQTKTSNGGATWSNKQFIVEGQNPFIAHFEGEEYALSFVSMDERPNSGGDTDIVLMYSKNSGSTWISPQIGNTYGLNDDGDWTSGDWITDTQPVMAKNTSGAWVVAWVKSYMMNNQVYSEVVASTADSSPPVGTVTSDLGEATINSTSLSFTASTFIDQESGISHYQWAFGNDTNPEAYKAFPTNLETSETVPSTITPADFSAFGAFFPERKYVFTIRVYNNLALETYNNTWLYRDVSVCVEVRPLKIGEDIPLPNGKTWADINWNTTTFMPATHALLLQNEQRFITTDHTVPANPANPDDFKVNWVFTDGSNPQTIDYEVAPAPVKEAMILYHTFNTTNPTLAPDVDVSGIPILIPHYNKTIPPPANPLSNSDPFWIDFNNKLQARGNATRAHPYIVLQYNDAQGNLIDFEIVHLKDNATDVPDGVVDIGSRILPYDSETPLSSCSTCPAIVDGLDDNLLYVHSINNTPQYRHIWAIKKNETASDVDIYWKRKGVLDIIDWPFEYRQYQAPDWPINNPEKYQIYVRGADEIGDTLGQQINIPSDLNANLQTLASEPPNSAHLEDAGTRFYTDDVGTGESWALLRYQTNSSDWVGFEVVKSIPRASILTTSSADIGTEITDSYHEGAGFAYIHEPQGDKYALDIHQETGQIFGVNVENLEVWWSNLSRITDPEGSQYPDWPSDESLRVQWPSKVVAYDVQWGDIAQEDKIIIARQNGSGVLDEATYGTDWHIYFENDETKVGFNPNDEHAIVAPFESGAAIFPLRDDLGSPTTSEPYVLMPYKEQPNNDLWRFRVFQVIREEAPYFFRDWVGIDRPIDRYEGNAGLLIQAPFPLSILPYAEENEAISGPFFEDKRNVHWAKAAGDDGGTAEILMRYHYPIQEGFYLETLPPGVVVGTQVPWLDDATTTPVDVTYTIHWPDDVPTMKLGQTIIDAQFGLPAIDGQCSVDILYEQSVANGGGSSVLLLDPIQTRSTDLATIPDDIKTEGNNTEMVFSDLSLALRRRIFYDTDNQKLRFRGEHISPVIGFDYAILNVMSAREKDELLNLSPDANWALAVNNLYNLSKDPIIIEDSDTDSYDLLALTSGLAEGIGYVTLTMQNAMQCDNLPISLEIIRVIPELETNDLAVISPSCPFDETLTLRHKGDFGGNSDPVIFEWRYLPDENGIPPNAPIENWLVFNPTPANGEGALDISIRGAGLLTLSDNWISCRYQTSADAYLPNTWSEWTEPQLTEGWIKRVVGDINAFTQRASGGGIEGAENKFFDFGEQEVNTIVSMLRQSGARWTGNIPLNCANIDDFGLIEIYETVLGRGVDLSIGGIPTVDYPPANKALLLVASRIADMYTLMGNEAYADAADPTIAYGTEDGTYGAEASSIHCFQNQSANLLEEELGLLRGRDASNAPSVDLYPVYNKLYWNFTNGDGEVAYAANYDIQDQTGNTDGTIDEADARLFYPQGHGDAWGHYLQATKTYYKLLQHPNYTWLPRAEGVLLGGQPITVDYFDERKFAKAAAAKARTGAEIVDLTYRSAYVENPEGQWQGYKDVDEDRAWGFDEWADRAGQAAYFDWVVGNAILPSVDNDQTGIQKIDRTTVLELREIASSALQIQTQLDEANSGLNPLGLATNVVPFDISPALIDQGETHFEQIYGRAVTSMNNAITVFNHANNSTQLLRRQNDSQLNFEQNVEEREVDFKNRLIEIFGYPYADDIGPGETYPTGYDGYDKYHFNYVDASQLMLENLPSTVEVTTYFTDLSIDNDGVLTETAEEVIFHLSNTADQFGEIKPADWTGQRRAPGEIQMARSELIQAKGRMDRALLEYDNFMANIDGQLALLAAQYQVNADEINVLNIQLNEQESLLNLIARSRERQLKFRTIGRMATLTANALAEFLPTSVGFSTDVTAPGRGAIRLAGTIINEAMSQTADQESLAELDHQQTMQLMSAQTNLTLTIQRQEQAILQQINQLQQTMRQEASLRLELFSLQENIQQAIGRYNSVLAKGHRLQEDLIRFRRQTAANVQSRRYKDMAFRIFRNDALQKYRAQYDLAARYVYLAAKAYDYETTLLSGSNSGQNFLTDIIKQRLIGTIQSGIPQTGQGLADPMRQMADNFAVFKGQLGFNNPQQETNRFSLRSELFRIGTGFADNETWRNTLREYVVDNVFDIPEFRRYCNSFTSNPLPNEPAIVIPFSSTITFGLNFFGNELQGGDHAYSESNYTTKVRSVGTWFSNYNTLAQNGLSATPRVYLIPVGSDIQRSPSNNNSGEIREFKILDQLVPAPFSNISGSDLADPDWIPIADNLGSDFGQTRQFSDFRAYHDAGSFNTNEVQRDSRLIGRSVWNTRWLLIIPAGTLLFDRDEGINRFIDGQEVNGTRNGNGVSDIKIFFETYAFPGF